MLAARAGCALGWGEYAHRDGLRAPCVSCHAVLGDRRTGSGHSCVPHGRQRDSDLVLSDLSVHRVPHARGRGSMSGSLLGLPTTAILLFVCFDWASILRRPARK